MDKYEYEVCADEIRSLIQQKKYNDAVKIADKIDWKNVKNSIMLCTVSDLYKICGRYEDSRDLLVLAYQRNPSGRMILYSLCELSLKLGDINNAAEYYREYVQVAPKDSGRLVLKYKLYRAQEVDLDKQIAVLEELKRTECKEKWMYELAYLYHMMGYEEKCVEECDQIVIYFGEGKYVLKALELKRSHQPLSGEQTLLYAKLTEPASEEILVKDIDVGQYNTIDLQKELANNMKEVLFDDSEAKASLEEEKAVTAVFEPVLDNTDEKIAAESVKTPEIKSINDVTQIIHAEEVRKEIEKPKEIHHEAAVNGARSIMNDGEVKPSSSVSRVVQPNSAGFFRNDISGLMVESQSNPAIKFPDYDDMVSMEGDGQIAFVMPEEKPVDKQITGQISISDVLLEWERMKSESEKKWAEGMRRKVAEQTSGLLKAFEETAHDGLLESLENEVISSDVSNDITEAVETEEEKSEAEEIISVKEPVNEPVKEPKPVEVREIIFDDEPTPQELFFDRTPYISENAQDEQHGETIPEETEVSSYEDDDYLMRFAEASEARDREEQEEETFVPLSATVPTIEISVSEVEEEPACVEEEPSVQEVFEEVQEVFEPEVSLTEEVTEPEPEERFFTPEQEEQFEAFIQNESGRNQLAFVLKEISTEKSRGNLIIVSDDVDSPLELGKAIIRELSERGIVNKKVAKIKASTLNAKDAEATLGPLEGGALIVQNANELRRETLNSIRRALENEEMFVVFAILRRAKQRFMHDNSDMLDSFTSVFEIEPLDDKELVDYAIKYALSREYSIDEMGMLELHRRIDEKQTNDHFVLVPEVKKLVDEAIAHAMRKTPAHFFKLLTGKRYDENDMVVLTQKDFEDRSKE